MERKINETAPQTSEDMNYAFTDLNNSITDSVKNYITESGDIGSTQIIEAPAETGFDYGINLTRVAKSSGRNPVEFSKELADKINSQDHPFIETAVAIGPFLNFRIDIQKFGGSVLSQIFTLKDEYGKETIGKGQKIVIDMSSPNIAKRMSVGHLRSTIIGDALANLHRAKGYEVIRDNHLGDWGTQFGKLIVAIKKWGNEPDLLKSPDPIGVLQDLYVRFHSEAKKETQELRDKASAKIAAEGIDSVPGLQEAIENVSQEIMKRKKIERSQLDMEKVREDALDRVIESDLDREGRNWFLRLEQGDKEAKRLWKLCLKLSMKEFNQIYKTLKVGFEKTLGESFYEPMLKDTIKRVKESPIGEISEGALVIDMNDAGLGIAIVRKSDGASVYFTRDLACAIYREEEMKADKAIYVVGEDQKQYFQQLFEALRRLGYKIGESSEHVYFGMIRLSGGKMSTREGKVVLLKDVIKEGLKRAGDILKQKNPELDKNKKLSSRIVKQVAIGALKWNDLSQDPRKTIIFDWDKALKLEGNSAPYVQYTAVRANSILDSIGLKKGDFPANFSIGPEVFRTDVEKALIRTLSEYPTILSEALKENSPTKVASYVYELAKRFNAFYTNAHVLKAESDDLKTSRLMLVAATSQVITNALGILGIEVPQRM